MAIVKKALIAGTAALALFVSGCSGSPASGSKVEYKPVSLEGNQVWSSYGTATSAYAELAAVSEAFTKAYSSQVRIIGSDTGIGRLTPVKSGQANMGRLSDEAFLAFEGSDEFASADWGPQDLRVVWNPPTTVAVGVRDGEGINALSDLKGKKVPWMPANPSAQQKIEGILAYAGLTPEDVKKVEVDYSEQPKALQDKQIDMAYFGVTSAGIIEVANTMKFKWLDFDGGEAAEDRMQELAPTVTIEEFDSPVGMDGRKTVHAPTYSIQMTTYAARGEDEVYEFAKAINDQLPNYEKTTPTGAAWSIDAINPMPLMVPFHDGTVKYLKEQGKWTEAAQKRNDELVKRQETLTEGWTKVTESGATADELAAKWSEWKENNAPLSLPVRVD